MANWNINLGGGKYVDRIEGDFVEGKAKPATNNGGTQAKGKQAPANFTVEVKGKVIKGDVVNGEPIEPQ